VVYVYPHHRLSLIREGAQLRIGDSGDGGLLLLRIKQNIDQFVESRVSSLIDFFRFDGADRMLHDQQRMIGRAKCFPF